MNEQSSNEVVLLTVIGFVLFGGWLVGLWLWQNRKRKPAAAQPRPNPTTAQPAAASTPAAMPGQIVPELPALAMAGLPAAPIRKQTLLVAKSGLGKTQALISIAMADLRAGHDVYWLSPDATAYNQRDQPTDIREIAIQIVDDFEDIAAHIRAAAALIEQRRPAYKANTHHGQPVTLLIDEWPAIAAFDAALAKELTTILFLGRKVDVWLVLASQSPYVDDLKLGSGLRDAFHTALGRGLDKNGQRALGVGDCQGLARGLWAGVGANGVGVVTIPMATIRPSDSAIAAPNLPLVGGRFEAGQSGAVSLPQTTVLDDSNQSSTDTEPLAAGDTELVPVPDKRAISKLSSDQQLDFIISTLASAGVGANVLKKHLQLQGDNGQRLSRIRRVIGDTAAPN